MNKLIILLITFILACSHSNSSDNFAYQSWIPDAAERDARLAEIIRYIYVPAQGVNKNERFDSKYDEEYAKHFSKFEMVSYFIDKETDWHYFFLIRPARNIHNHNRGVLGKLKVDKSGKIYEFEEVCNTPMLSVDDILERGGYLWRDLVYFKHIDRYIDNQKFVDFPSIVSIYDKEKHEWVFNQQGEIK